MSNPATNWQPDLGELRSVHAASAETVKETPVFSLGELSRRCGGRVVVKAENMQRTGSFKIRGALAKLAAPGAAGCPGVVAGSAGNHGQALAYAARARGIPCTVFMPRGAAISKVNAVTAFGAEVVLEGGAIDECLEAARRLAAEMTRSGSVLCGSDDASLIRHVSVSDTPQGRNGGWGRTARWSST